MAEVQWIKLKVGMFDGNSFKKIKRAKIGGVPFRDKLTSVWFELLDLAGKSNSNGYLIDNNEIPYRSFEDIATMLDREEKEIELCMQFFVSERMVEIIDDIYCLTNFVRFQNKDGLEKIREQNRERKRLQRERKKQVFLEVSRDSHVTLTECHDIEEEKEKEKDKEKEFHSFNHSCKNADYIEKKIADEELEGEDAEVYRQELKERLKIKYIGGTLGEDIIRMSDEQFYDLCDNYSLEEIGYYFDIIKNCERSGKHFKKKTHYQAFKEMADKDRRIK